MANQGNKMAGFSLQAAVFVISYIRSVDLYYSAESDHILKLSESA